MRALVKDKAEPGLWLQDLPVPAIGRDDVLIKVLRTGVCGTDLHIYEWDGWAQANVPVPLVIGHEFVGEIVQLGSDVQDLAVGELKRSKGVVRGTLARRFPTLALERQRKVAATSYYHSLIQREGQMLADAAGDFPALSKLGIIDSRVARAAVRGGLKHRGSGLHRIWEAVNLEIWARSHGGEQHG